ncbi:MAG: HDOD domain-containing protein [Chitinivibrionales bacterium]|nr:HDOD domain-containing protein [Chitinivibrionales bacterium]
MNSILAELQKIKDLPTLPEVLLNVQAMISSEDTDAATLEHFICHDPALASSILKTANSVYYNHSNRRVTSVRESIVRIGLNEVARITLAVKIIQQFPNTKSVIGYKSYWQHSLTTAGMTEVIADMIQIPPDSPLRQELFVSGLLHDIGILILDQFFHEHFSAIITHSLQEGKTFLNAEQEVAPKETHMFIGGTLLEMWKFPFPVVGAVRFHHVPEKAPEKINKHVAIVALSEYILCNNKKSFEGRFEHLDASIWPIIGLPPESEAQLSAKVESEVGKSEIILSIGKESSDYHSWDEKDYSDEFQFKPI